MQLNQKQKLAVEANDATILIVAGAGTGKTSTITEKIHYILKNKLASAEQILALTFTEKASEEMLARLDQVLPYGYQEPWAHTFHGFCDRILKNESLEIGLSPDYKIADTTKQWLIIKKHIFELDLDYYAPINNPNKFIRALLKFFSRIQDEDIQLNEFADFVNSSAKDKSPEAREKTKKYQELFKAYKKYQQLKLKENVLDFGDLLFWTLKLFRNRPNVLKKYQKQFKYILVDEFQDTNFAQLQLIKLLFPNDKNNKDSQLTVVGDDNQAIYAFRGSSVYNILDFKKHYPNSKEIILTTNYRSGQKILNSSYNLIKNNNPNTLEFKLGIDKRLVSARGKNLPKPEIFITDTVEDEVKLTISKIIDLTNQGYSYQDFAILARSNAQLDPFVAGLKRAGLPYQLIGNRGLFDQPEIRELIFFLKTVADPENGNALFYFLHNPVFKIPSEEILKLLKISKNTQTSLWEVVQKQSLDNKLTKVVELIKYAQKYDTKKTITEIVYDFIEKTNFIKPFLKKDSIENQLKLKNINLFFDKLKGYDQEYNPSSASEYVEYLELLIEAGENPAQAELEDVDTVNLLTVHASKGLEWPVVFVVSATSDRFPTRNIKDVIELPSQLVKQDFSSTNFHLEEERRLFYVAMTRARDYLFLSYAENYGGKRKKRPSPFLLEIQRDNHEIKLKKWQPQQKQLLLFNTLQLNKDPLSKQISNSEIELTSLSHSKIDAYQTCPLKYKYQYILNIPVKPHHAFAFGSSVHNTLQKFHAFEIQGQKPNLDTLLKLYEENFQNIGYTSIAHREKAYLKGQQSLTKYFQNYKQTFLGKPTFLEKSFKLKIDDVKLIGRIDRIDNLENDKSLELIDYKTGKAKDQKTVDKDAQLTIYAMASQQLFGVLPKSLCLYFINDNLKVTTTRNQVQIDKKRQEISEVIAQIKAGNFEAKPGRNNCKYCPYKDICPKAMKS